MSKRIGIFVDGLVLPPKEGINVHIVQLARDLALRQGCQVTLIIGDRGWAKYQDLAKESFSSVLINPTIFYDKSAIKKIIDECKLDILQTHSPYYTVATLSPIATEKKLPLVLEIHDIEADVSKALGSNSKEIEYQRALQNLSIHLASRIRVMSCYDYEILERELTAEDYKKCHWIPLSVESPKINKTPAKTLIDKPYAVFIGNLSYKPNYDGLSILIDQALPQLQSIGCQLVAIGRGSDGLQVRRSFRGLGMVDDLSPYLNSAVVGLAPILGGSGMKVKILTYLSFGIPVITTTVGSRGYPTSPAIFIEDDIAKYAATIKQNHLMNDNHLLKKEAYHVYRSNFSPEVINKKLNHFYQEILPVNKCFDSKLKLKKPVWLQEDREKGDTQTDDVLFVQK